MRQWLFVLFGDPSYFQSKKCYKNCKSKSISEAVLHMSFSHRQWVFTCRIVAVCLIWYAASCSQSIINKLTLQLYPYPLTVTLSSLVNNAIYALPLARILNVKFQTVTTRYLLKIIFPIAFAKSVALASAFFGLWKVPVSYAQTVKATLPIFTVLISRIVLHERQSKRVYLSLVPIVLGVVTASASELSFNTAGLLASLFSTFINSCINVSIKKVFDDTGMHPISLLSLTSQLAAVILFPLWIFEDGYSLATKFLMSDPSDNERGHPDFYFVFLLFAAGLCSFFQNLCSFVLIHQLTTLSFAVSNAAKRVAVIVISLFIFKNPVTPLNCLGMLLSIVGMFIYNRVKHPNPDKLHRDDDGPPQLFKKHSSRLSLNHFTTSDSDYLQNVQDFTVFRIARDH
uniref:Sugar phosphate transporter domain-containing protein n=1 Tax=Panagrolaimus sp. JU765 TaxID=591449 RepID=A0AC34R6D9_9BILA